MHGRALATLWGRTVFMDMIFKYRLQVFKPVRKMLIIVSLQRKGT